MTTVIRKASSADLLAALPALVGRAPRQSVVLIAFRGKRTHAALRFDLPRAGFARFTSTAVGMFCKIEGAEDVVPVICSDDAVITHDELMTVVVRRFRHAGFAVRDALVMGSDGWGSHFDPDRRVHPLAEIADAAERLALEPNAPLPERVPRADDLSCRRMRDELAQFRMLVAGDGECEPDDLGALDPIADLPFFAEGAMTWTDAELAGRGALLLFALQGPPARDLVMLQWAFGLDLGDAMWSADTCFGIEARKVYTNVDELAAELMLGRGPSPDVARIEAAIALLTTLISRADDVDRPAPLCMLAWLTWALGRGSDAGTHVDEVRAIAPDYSMGQLLHTMFRVGTMPDWVFSSPQIP